MVGQFRVRARTSTMVDLDRLSMAGDLRSRSGETASAVRRVRKEPDTPQPGAINQEGTSVQSQQAPRTFDENSDPGPIGPLTRDPTSGVWRKRVKYPPPPRAD